VDAEVVKVVLPGPRPGRDPWRQRLTRHEVHDAIPALSLFPHLCSQHTAPQRRHVQPRFAGCGIPASLHAVQIFESAWDSATLRKISIASSISLKLARSAR